MPVPIAGPGLCGLVGGVRARAATAATGVGRMPGHATCRSAQRTTTGTGTACALRVCGRLLQSQASAFGAGLSLSGGVRAGLARAAGGGLSRGWPECDGTLALVTLPCVAGPARRRTVALLPPPARSVPPEAQRRLGGLQGVEIHLCDRLQLRPQRGPVQTLRQLLQPLPVVLL